MSLPPHKEAYRERRNRRSFCFALPRNYAHSWAVFRFDVTSAAPMNR
jgi:hypothetical protein